MNLYARLPQLRRAANLGSDHTGEDDRLLDIAEQMSRAVDNYIGYPAYERKGETYISLTRLCPANEWGRVAYLSTPVVSVDSLVADTDADGTYDLTLTSSDYVMEPTEGPDVGKPYWRIRLLPGGALGAIPTWPRALKLTGTLGVPHGLISTGVTLTANISATVLTMSGPVTDIIWPGDTILVGAERMAVEAVSGSTVTVRRGINGTTATSHTAAAVSVVEPPPVLTRALLAWVGRMSWDELSGYQGSVVMTDVGGSGVSGFQSRSSTAWAAIRSLLVTYRRVGVA
jgi:hypothetical protein